MKLAGVGVLSVLLLFILGSFFGSSISFFLEPLRVGAGLLGGNIDEISLLFEEKVNLRNENNMLKDRLAALSALEERVQLLEDENTALRGLSTTEGVISSGVIVRPPHSPYDTLLVGKGSRDGVTEGAVVYAPNGVVIGSVAKVFQGSAVVVLASTSGVRSSVYIYGPDIFTHAEGQGGGVLRVTVPQGVALEEGNVVALPGVPGSLYGTIRHIEASDSSPGKYGFITTNTPLQSLNIVGISTEPYEQIDFDTARAAIESLRSRMFLVDIPEEILIEEASTTPPLSE